MTRPTLMTLTLLLLCPGLCRADAFLLKSGRTVRGALVEKKGEVYLVKDSETGKTLELPVSQVAIADIDPASAAMPKGNVSVIGTDKDGKDAPTDSRTMVNILPDSAPAGGADVPHLAGSGLLKNAEDTVKLSNQRTTQTVEEINRMKAIADAANGQKSD